MQGFFQAFSAIVIFDFKLSLTNAASFFLGDMGVGGGGVVGLRIGMLGGKSPRKMFVFLLLEQYCRSKKLMIS